MGQNVDAVTPITSEQCLKARDMLQILFPTCGFVLMVSPPSNPIDHTVMVSNLQHAGALNTARTAVGFMEGRLVQGTDTYQ